MCVIAEALRDAEKLICRLENVISRPAGPATIAAGIDDAVLALSDLVEARGEIAKQLERRSSLPIGVEQRLIDQARHIDRQIRALNAAEARLASLLVWEHRHLTASLQPIF